MRTRTSFLLFGGAAFGAAMSLITCGGTQDTPDGGDSGGGGDAGDAKASDVVSDSPSTKDSPADAPDETSPPNTTGEPPPPPDGGVATTNVYTFAVQTVYLGESPRGGGPPSNSAWKAFGYDVDGLVTTSSSVNVCTLYSGAPKGNQVDGDYGIDNAWGAVLLPILQSASSNPAPSATETSYIDQGNWTLQIQVKGLSDDANQSALGLTMQLFVGATTTSTPAFDTTTNWPVLSTSVNDGATIASGATVKFASAYVNGGTVVSGAGSTPVVLQFSSGGVSLALTIHDPVLTFDHTAHATAANGTISGVLDTQEFITAMQAVAGNISTSLCGSAFDGIAQQIEQAQDILKDGTNTSGPPCNAISIGLGFEATLIHDPTTVVTAPPPPPNPCGD